MGDFEYLISGCSPEGVRRRLEASQLDGRLRCMPWEYGTRLVATVGDTTAAALESSFSPYIVPANASGTVNPAAELVGLASDAGRTLVLAESCTGGLAGALVTEISGSSRVFWGSLVTYANEAKEKVLGVDTLSRFGAVSEATVLSMTQGALKLSGADVAAAISGIAGPGGGTEEKPVGTVWFAFGGEGGYATLCCRFSGDRREVRNKAASVALSGLKNQFTKPILDIGWIAGYTFY